MSKNLQEYVVLVEDGVVGIVLCYVEDGVVGIVLGWGFQKQLLSAHANANRRPLRLKKKTYGFIQSG